MIKYMEKYVLDTNVFFNMEPGLGLGKKTEEVVINVTKIGKDMKKEKKGELFMPPRAIDEFLSFFKDKEQEFITDFLSVITIKSPDISKMQFSSGVFYKIVQDIRNRSYKGLNIGEEEIQNAGHKMMGKKDLKKQEFEMEIGGVIKSFRERYRKATRFGFLDSLADLDVIVLAKEQDAFLITSDEGVLKWAKLFGVKEMPALAWKKRFLLE